MFDVLVVNASPLIFLGNAGRIDLLRATGAGRIIGPEPVFDEVTAAGHSDAAARAIADAAWLEKGRLPEIPASVIAWDLGAENHRSSPQRFSYQPHTRSSTI
jgi:hypothetical protein